MIKEELKLVWEVFVLRAKKIHSLKGQEKHNLWSQREENLNPWHDKY